MERLGAVTDMNEKRSRKVLVGCFVPRQLAEDLKREAVSREQSVAGFLRLLIRRELDLR